MDRKVIERVDRVIKIAPHIMTMISEMHATNKTGSELTFNQYQALRIINQSEILSVNDIARMLRLGQSATSQLIDRMVKAELVTREIDQRDRRRMEIQLSKKGKRMLEKRTEAIRDAYLRIFSRLNEEDQTRFEEAFVSFFHIAQALTRGAAAHHPGGGHEHTNPVAETPAKTVG